MLFEIKKMNTDTPPFLLETVYTVPLNISLMY